MRQSGPPGPPGFGRSPWLPRPAPPRILLPAPPGAMSGQGEGALFQHQRTGLQFSMSICRSSFAPPGLGGISTLGFFRFVDSARRDHRIAVHPAVGVQQAHLAPLGRASPAPVCRACGRRSSSTITFIRNKRSRAFQARLGQPEEGGLHEVVRHAAFAKSVQHQRVMALAVGFQICDAIGDMAGHGSRAGGNSCGRCRS